MFPGSTIRRRSAAKAAANRRRNANARQIVRSSRGLSNAMFGPNANYRSQRMAQSVARSRAGDT